MSTSAPKNYTSPAEDPASPYRAQRRIITAINVVAVLLIVIGLLMFLGGNEYERPAGFAAFLFGLVLVVLAGVWNVLLDIAADVRSIREGRK